MPEGLAGIGEYGVGIAALIILFLIVKMIVDILTKVLQENTKAINKLSGTLEKSNSRDELFHSEMLKIVNATHVKVSDIHKKVV